MSDAPRLWDKLPDEPAGWFSRFSKYLSMGTKRTAQAIWEAEGRDRGGKTTPGNWDSAIAKYRWVERAAAFDKAQGEKTIQKLEDIHNELAESYGFAAKEMATLLKALMSCKTEEEIKELKTRILAASIATGKGGLARSATDAFRAIKGIKVDANIKAKLSWEVAKGLEEAAAAIAATQEEA